MTRIKPTTYRLSQETRRQIEQLRTVRGGDESGAAIITMAVAQMHWRTFADGADAQTQPANATNADAADAADSPHSAQAQGE